MKMTRAREKKTVMSRLDHENLANDLKIITRKIDAHIEGMSKHYMAHSKEIQKIYQVMYKLNNLTIAMDDSFRLHNDCKSPYL